MHPSKSGWEGFVEKDQPRLILKRVGQEFVTNLPRSQITKKTKEHQKLTQKKKNPPKTLFLRKNKTTSRTKNKKQATLFLRKNKIITQRLGQWTRELKGKKENFLIEHVGEFVYTS